MKGGREFECKGVFNGTSYDYERRRTSISMEISIGAKRVCVRARKKRTANRFWKRRSFQWSAVQITKFSTIKHLISSMRKLTGRAWEWKIAFGVAAWCRFISILSDYHALPFHNKFLHIKQSWVSFCIWPNLRYERNFLFCDDSLKLYYKIKSDEVSAVKLNKFSLPESSMRQKKCCILLRTVKKCEYSIFGHRRRKILLSPNSARIMYFIWTYVQSTYPVVLSKISSELSIVVKHLNLTSIWKLVFFSM